MQNPQVLRIHNEPLVWVDRNLIYIYIYIFFFFLLKQIDINTANY